MSARRRGTARDVAGTKRDDDAIATRAIRRRRVGASIIADAAPNESAFSRPESLRLRPRAPRVVPRSRARRRAFAYRAFAPSARSTALRMRSIFTGSSTYPSPRVNFECTNSPATVTSSAPLVVGVGAAATEACGNFATTARSIAVAKRR
jgi:hypothetical protein